MRQHDLDQVLAIERGAFPVPWPRRFFEQEIARKPGARAVVAVLDGDIVGYRVAWSLDGEVHLGNVAVKASHRRRGIGQALLLQLVEEARRIGSSAITLEVRATNRAAIALYARNLFRPMGIRKGYYRGKEDALIMTRLLESS